MRLRLAGQRAQQAGIGLGHQLRAAQHPDVVGDFLTTQPLRAGAVAGVKVAAVVRRIGKYRHRQITRLHGIKRVLDEGFYLPGFAFVLGGEDEIGDEHAHRAGLFGLQLQGLAQHLGQLGAAGGVLEAAAHRAGHFLVGAGHKHARVGGGAFLKEIVRRRGLLLGLLPVHAREQLGHGALEAAARSARPHRLHEALHAARHIHKHVDLAYFSCRGRGGIRRGRRRFLAPPVLLAGPQQGAAYYAKPEHANRRRYRHKGAGMMVGLQY